MKVLYPGGFDYLHAGHRAALTTARTIAGRYGYGQLIAAVNSDQLMRHYKREPGRSEQERLQELQALGIADEAMIWDGPEGQAERILQINPDIYIAGTDWLTKDLAAQLGVNSLAWFDEHNISLMFLRRTPGISTTQIINQRKA